MDDAPFYPLLRHMSERADFVCFSLNNGRQHLLSVADITEFFYHPDNGIILFFHAGMVHIEGRNLDMLFRYLQDRRVKEIREFSEQEKPLFDAKALYIQRITFESENLKRIGM